MDAEDKAGFLILPMLHNHHPKQGAGRNYCRNYTMYWPTTFLLKSLCTEHYLVYASWRLVAPNRFFLQKRGKRAAME